MPKLPRAFVRTAREACFVRVAARRLTSALTGTLRWAGPLPRIGRPSEST